MPSGLKNRSRKLQNKKDQAALASLVEITSAYESLTKAIAQCFDATDLAFDVLSDDINTNFGELFKAGFFKDHNQYKSLLSKNLQCGTDLRDIGALIKDIHKFSSKMAKAMAVEKSNLEKKLNETSLDEEVEVDDTNPDNEENQSKGVGRKLLDKVKRMVGR